MFDFEFYIIDRYLCISFNSVNLSPFLLLFIKINTRSDTRSDTRPDRRAHHKIVTKSE